jgi:autotransporter adhesin
MLRLSLLIFALFSILIATIAHAAVRGTDAKFVGGTVTGIPENTEGKFDLTGEESAVFTVKGGQKVVIPYKTIQSLEYGQKAGRRVGVALAVSPLLLLSKKRKHFLSIAFLDEQGQKQGAVFELAKGVVRSSLSTFETRSGKPIEYESEEAKKHAGN